MTVLIVSQRKAAPGICDRVLHFTEYGVHGRRNYHVENRMQRKGWGRFVCHESPPVPVSRKNRSYEGGPVSGTVSAF
jgi:hypothetical protein